MSPNSTWLDTRTTQLRGTLLGLGLTITDSQARVLLNDKLDDYARLMHVTRRTAQRHFTDEQLAIFANSLAAAISDEAPGEPMTEFERTIPMPTNALGLTIAALAEALKVAHGNLEEHSLTDGLSHLSTLGMIAADARTNTRTGTVPPCPGRCCCGSLAFSTTPRKWSARERTCPTASTKTREHPSSPPSNKTPTDYAPSRTPKTVTRRNFGVSLPVAKHRPVAKKPIDVMPQSKQSRTPQRKARAGIRSAADDLAPRNLDLPTHVRSYS